MSILKCPDCGNKYSSVSGTDICPLSSQHEIFKRRKEERASQNKGVSKKESEKN